MSDSRMTDALFELAGEVRHLSTDVRVLAERQPSASDIVGLAKGQAELQSGLAGVRAGQVVLQADVAALKEGQTALKTDVAELKTDMVVVKGDVADLAAAQMNQSTALALLAADVTDLRKSHLAFREETNSRFDQLTDLVETSNRELRALVEESRAETRAQIEALCARIDAWNGTAGSAPA